MDIYSAETYVTKLLSYVKELNDTKPNMYRKSKNRLRDLAFTCNEVVKIISEILQDEALEQDEIEFGYANRNEVCTMISSMQDQLNNLKNFVNYQSESEDTVQVHATFKTSKISSQMRKQTIMSYSQCLSKLATSDIQYPVVNDCSKLIWRWFDDRFLSTPKTHPDFRYNIRRLSTWLRDIVIVYSIAVDEGNIDDFISEFYRWCDSLYNTDAGDKFAVPYSIYKASNAEDVEDVSATAAVIWDILLDSGLRELCTSDPYDLYPSEDCVYRRCGEVNPQCLDVYVDYKEDSNILATCKLIGGAK